MNDKVTDEQLWSWVDRDAADLARYLERHPDERSRIDAVRRELRALASIGGADHPCPDAIGPYRVTGILGAGGMGVVYAAIQQSPQREVAVKVMRDATAPGAARFAREIEALGRLQHPAIATIHEAGTTTEGVPYLVMERVRGRPLTAWATATAADLRARVAVMAAIADGVDAAHRAGVAHRDLKPGNVLVDDAGQPKLLDFGLARLATPAIADVDLTQPGSFAGTLGYVAPERLAHEDLAPGPRDDASGIEAGAHADVYSLGVMLFELLTGRLPHPVTGVSLAALVDAVCRGRTPLPSTTAAGVPPALDRIAAHALAREPGRRYPTAADLAADLRRFLAGRPVHAPALPKTTPRPRTRAALVGLALASLVAAAAWWARAAGAAPVAPYAGLQWAGDQPEVLVAGEWMQLRAVAGLTIEAIVATCKEAGGGDWKQLFTEDLAGVMRRLGRELEDRVELRVADLDGQEARTLADVPQSRANHAALLAAGARSVAHEVAVAGTLRERFDPRAAFPTRAPFVAVRVVGGHLEGQLEAGQPYREWLAIDAIEVDELSRICRRAFGPLWLKRITEDLVQVAALLGHELGDRVTLTLRDEQGRATEIEGVAMTEDKRRKINLINR